MAGEYALLRHRTTPGDLVTLAPALALPSAPVIAPLGRFLAAMRCAKPAHPARAMASSHSSTGSAAPAAMRTTRCPAALPCRRVLPGCQA